uniref:Uncharacterized protein n=1 Tax=Amphimedon queenslandica TaxID=400682 RepID=A0A1X7UNQ9_AMPQE
MSVLAASKKFGIPKSTLRDHLKDSSCKIGVGHPTIFFHMEKKQKEEEQRQKKEKNKRKEKKRNRKKGRRKVKKEIKKQRKATPSTKIAKSKSKLLTSAQNVTASISSRSSHSGASEFCQECHLKANNDKELWIGCDSTSNW